MSYSSDPAGLQNQIAVSIQFPEEQPALSQNLNDVYQKLASTINAKEDALYLPLEKITSQQYFKSGNPQKFKNVYRMTVDFGSLPNAGTKSVAHNISWGSTYRLTRSYGGSTDPVNLESLPIPNDGIMLKIDSTNVVITTSTDLTAFTECTVVVEYTKEI